MQQRWASSRKLRRQIGIPTRVNQSNHAPNERVQRGCRYGHEKPYGSTTKTSGNQLIAKLARLPWSWFMYFSRAEAAAAGREIRGHPGPYNRD